MRGYKTALRGHNEARKEVRITIFPFILSRLLSLVMQRIRSFFKQFCLEKKAAYALMALFNRVPFLFIAYANIPIKCL